MRTWKFILNSSALCSLGSRIEIILATVVIIKNIEVIQIDKVAVKYSSFDIANIMNICMKLCIVFIMVNPEKLYKKSRADLLKEIGRFKSTCLSFEILFFV